MNDNWNFEEDKKLVVSTYLETLAYYSSVFNKTLQMKFECYFCVPRSLLLRH